MFDDDQEKPRVAAGGYHTVLLIAGEVYGSGSNEFGQLGLGAQRVQPSFVLFTLPAAPMPHIRSVALGTSHTLLVATDGRAFSCGANPEGRLGYRTIAESGSALRPILYEGEDCRFVGAAAGDRHSLLVTAGGSVLVCGDNTLGQVRFHHGRGRRRRRRGRRRRKRRRIF